LDNLKNFDVGLLLSYLGKLKNLEKIDISLDMSITNFGVKINKDEIQGQRLFPNLRSSCISMTNQFKINS